MGILGHFMGKSVYWSALSGHLYGCLQPFLIAHCVCRGDGTEPFRVGARKGEVEFETIQKDPHPRNLEQGSIVILLEYYLLLRAACWAANKTVLINFLCLLIASFCKK